MNLPVLPWLPYVAIVLTKIFFGLGSCKFYANCPIYCLEFNFNGSMLPDNWLLHITIPVVPHKAVAEVSKIGNL